MIAFLLVLIFAILAGFLTGLLAIAGGIIFVPLFMYLFPALGFKEITLNQITGLMALQIFIGSLFAFFAHKKLGNIDKKIIKIVAFPAGIGSITGAYISKSFNDEIFLIVFLILTFLSMIAFATVKENESQKTHKILPVLSSLFIGSIAGSLGLTGTVLYVPMLMHFFGITIKTGISTITLVVFVTSIMSFTGKVITNQIAYEYAVPVITGTLIGVWIGAKLSNKLSSQKLKITFFILMTIGAIKVLLDLL